MADWEDVLRIGLTLPEVEEAPSYRGSPALKVVGRPVCRLWSQHEHERDDVNDGEVVVVFCDPEAKEALIEASEGALFESPHHAGHGAVLINLADVDLDDLRMQLAWSYRLRAPKRLVRLLDEGRPAAQR